MRLVPLRGLQVTNLDWHRHKGTLLTMMELRMRLVPLRGLQETNLDWHRHKGTLLTMIELRMRLVPLRGLRATTSEVREAPAVEATRVSDCGDTASACSTHQSTEVHQTLSEQHDPRQRSRTLGVC